MGIIQKTSVSRLRLHLWCSCLPKSPPTPTPPHPSTQGAPVTLVCSPYSLGGEGGALRMERALFCAVDLPGRSRSPSTQDTTLCPFLAMAFLWGVLGDRRDPIRTNKGKVRLGC